ncbi:MAG TPA: hypothetical protein VE548_12025 [Nitrososphaeraceae archaeon]|nr:hypothetical protein [Nitrososphaeraceae archaeon]
MTINCKKLYNSQQYQIPLGFPEYNQSSLGPMMTQNINLGCEQGRSYSNRMAKLNETRIWYRMAKLNETRMAKLNETRIWALTINIPYHPCIINKQI